uniref:uncharacterized protein LOC108950316 n=1 Tax=Ciona intestinalis TaxID=7719 RepID=UPI00089DD3E1|nr:uncharacterized protein LOC108950316 [Ciona intestinalis]XP_018671313.1 uncharacterized protein LOC108950316 [Ciona intestinalis]XP_026694455.1 uncharacterized protein LOC108950316 [Ciona intestinalis]|eukprot:XP_018671312.1 uncharacterized protein LOC108950316 [Ciona intestinalis]
MDDIVNVPSNLRDEAIQNIDGLNVYDAAALEKGVIDKLDKDLKEKEDAKIKKKIDKIMQDVRLIKSLLRQNEKARSMLQDSEHSMAHVEKVKVLLSQRNKYESQLKALESKIGEIRRVQRLQNLTQDDVMED